MKIGLVGDKWAKLTVSEIIQKPIMRPMLGGKEYFGGEYEEPVYVLDCSCGGRVEIRESEFPGRKRLKQCGLEGCEEHTEALKMQASAVGRKFVIPSGAGGRVKVDSDALNEYRKQRQQPKTVVQVYMPVQLAARVDAYAIKYDLASRSNTIKILLESALNTAEE
jgi:hypothetical protein